jgi:hypothetical protein
MTCFFFEGFSRFGVLEGRGSEEKCRYIMRISPKTILTTGEDRRSLSYTILDMYNFNREVMRAL